MGNTDKYIELRDRLDVIQKSYRKKGVAVKYILNEFIGDYRRGEYVDLHGEEYKDIDLIAQMESAIFKKGNSGDDVVYTPPHITKFMADLIGVSDEDVLLDLCAGTGSLMLGNTNYKHCYGFDISKDLLEKATVNAEMKSLDDKVTLTVRDGTGYIADVYGDNKPTKAVLNPPYSYRDKGLPFSLNALDNLEDGGLCTIITQSSAGSGGGDDTLTEILSRHTFLGSVKMDDGLFKPFAGVETHIYLFKAGTPHNYGDDCLFANVGDNYYKRTSRSMDKVGEPLVRLTDILEMFRSGEVNEEVGLSAKLEGNKLNYTDYEVIDTVPTELDFMRTVADYMDFQMKRAMDDFWKEMEEELGGK